MRDFLFRFYGISTEITDFSKNARAVDTDFIIFYVIWFAKTFNLARVVSEGCKNADLNSNLYFHS